MIKPMLYFATVPNGDLFLRALAKRTTRANNLCGFFPEVRKVLTAVMLRYPMTHILTADEYRSHATESLVADYHEGSIVVVNYPRRAKGLDRIPLQVTSYTTAQIARQIRASIDHLADAETAVDAMLLGRMTREGEVARARLQLHYPELARNARQQLQYLQERNNMGILSEKEISDYRANRKEILSGKHAAEVKLRVDMQQRQERDQRIAADPIKHKIDTMSQRRDELQRQGKKTTAYDDSLARLEQQRAQEQQQTAFLQSDEYKIVMETSEPLKNMVKEFDPDALAAVDAAYQMYANDHQDSDRFNSEMVSICGPAWTESNKRRRDAECASLKTAAELARADYEREEATHRNASVDALMNGGAK